MFQKFLWNRKLRPFVLWSLRLFPVKRGRVVCVCWGGQKYGCSPKAITDYIISNQNNRFEIAYAFHNPSFFKDSLPDQIKPLGIGQLYYYYWLATSHFIISNVRFSGPFFPYKKKGQQYVFTGHGGNGIKKIEFDTDCLPKAYMQMALEDSLRIDLLLSGSAYKSRVIRSAYRYQGEILELGTPRNDEYIKAIKAQAHEISSRNKHYLIYTPTFRGDGRRDVYGFDVDRIITALETRFGGEWYIRISSHPNMNSYYQEIYDFSHPRLIDVGKLELQPLLASSDALITDYSSAEMDFSLTKRPVFQLCKDRADYDRGFYINPESLPFPYAETDDQLVSNILNFDNEKYQSELEQFNREVIGLNETGHASEAVVEWMINKLN